MLPEIPLGCDQQAFLAAENGHAELIRTLWKAGANLEQHADDGSTPALASAHFLITTFRLIYAT
jgi:hypothetical protein